MIFHWKGWTYGLDGVLLKANQIRGIRNFNKDDFGLVPLNVATWGPFVLISIDQKILPLQNSTKLTLENAWLGSAAEILSTNGIDSSLKHVCRREYAIECNWKVFCDNYLDGGYHVPYAYGGLASRLKSTPTLLIWILILRFPCTLQKCQVIFDYFLDASLMDDNVFVQRSSEESERVQIEDIALCEGVQRAWSRQLTALEDMHLLLKRLCTISIVSCMPTSMISDLPDVCCCT